VASSASARTSLRIAALLALLLGASGGAARAEQVYRYVDERGVLHLSNVPADQRYREYRVGSAGGSGRGILILARRESSRVHIPGLSQKAAYALLPTARFGAARSPKAYDELIARAAARHGLPPALIKAVVKAESNFQPHALSNKGAQGLMQLMPETAEDLGVDDPFRPEQNVLGGTRYLRAMYDRFGDWEHALAAYNAGPVERVLHYYRRYDGDFSR
jgi:soluble lytic murein transglycosylase-like protein